LTMVVGIDDKEGKKSTIIGNTLRNLVWYVNKIPNF
jgi:hypothetical protein